ncbi:hypothetical protein ACQZV8_19140, partial [Magnetococcales bacterium HHB-1]
KPGRLYQCTQCGEIRCGSHICIGTAKSTEWWASTGVQCRSCGEGRYVQASIFAMNRRPQVTPGHYHRWQK